MKKGKRFDLSDPLDLRRSGTCFHPTGTLDLCPLTRVVGQVGEADGLALHLVGEAAQRHADLHLLRDALVLVRRRLEDDGDLPVHVRLRELAVGLPGVAPEDDLDVVCKRNGSEPSSENKFVVCLKRRRAVQTQCDHCDHRYRPSSGPPHLELPFKSNLSML